MTTVYDRLQHIALGIANAMKHLHSEPFQIVLRDLKPQNIGFDSHGIVKLFDLGMARPIAETDTAESGGTYRYLSPEAMLGRSISLQSDAYSFGVILYELATLGKPFDQYFQRGKFVRKEEYCNDVVMGGWRPDLSQIICRATARLISKCWDPSPRARPSFERIHDMLDHILSHRDGPGVIPLISPTAAESTTMMALSSPHPSLPSQIAAFRTSRTSRCSSMAHFSHGENNPISVSPPPTNHVTARGFFRGLKPLPNIGKRACSDNTVTTSVSSSGNCLDAESD
jgi:serine/threonine protein kinase